MLVSYVQQSESAISQFSHSVMSDSLWPHGLQHARPPCPPPTPAVYSNSCPLSRWYNPTISSSVILFSFYLQSFPASGSFQMSQFFTSGGQSIGVLASASVLLMNFQDWLPLGWIGWISLLYKGLLKINLFFCGGKPCGMQDLKSLARDQTYVPCTGSLKS